MENAYKSCVWTIPDNFLSYESFERALLRIDRGSSPGYPYLVQAPTNGDWLKWDGFQYDEDRKQALWHDVSWFLENEGEYYLRLFLKEEPHKPTKVESNRWRIIMASPLYIQMVWHMLFDYMNDLEVTNAYYIPSQQGIVLPGGGWKTFLRLWKSRGYDTGLDKTAWDWTVTSWLLKLDLEFRYRMCRGSQKEKWYEIAKRMYAQMFEHPIILTSDGNLWKQKYPGIMKSGCVNTISTNSHMQVMVHILACEDQEVSCYPLPVCCGDDTLQCLSQACDLVAYARYGAVVKSASAEIEFVGHEFTTDGPIPLYTPKHIAKALHVSDEGWPEYIDSMARMYCKNAEMFNFWSWMAHETGVIIHTREYYNYWYDNATD